MIKNIKIFNVCYKDYITQIGAYYKIIQTVYLSKILNCDWMIDLFLSVIN